MAVLHHCLALPPCSYGVNISLISDNVADRHAESNDDSPCLVPDIITAVNQPDLFVPSRARANEVIFLGIRCQQTY